MDMNQYLSMFIDESNDHLQSLNESMMGLEANPEDISIVQGNIPLCAYLKRYGSNYGL